MGAGEHVERLLKMAIVGQRSAIAGEQRPVTGMGDGGLFEHGDGLGALPGSAKRLAIAQGVIGVLGIGAMALAINIDGAARIGLGGSFGFFRRH